MSAHTPGPWHFDGEKIKGRDKQTLEVCGVSMPCGYVPRDSVGYANASLIAAAPELLDALRKAERYCPPNSEAEILARAAIAKAEGKT